MSKQYSCSELLTDFNMRDTDKVYEILQTLTEKYDWDWSPKLTKENLEKIKEGDGYDLLAIDSEGHDAKLRYGNNGYADLGFRFEAKQHCTSNNFPFLKKALDDIKQSALRSYDGGTKRIFREWEDKQ